MRDRLRKFGLTATLLTCLAGSASAQGTAFTYQGSLDDAGAPASGLHDFRFKLFDAASGGTQVGTVLCSDNVSVVEGVFTAQLDFGQQFATTAQRFMEVEVRTDTGLTCSNATGFAALTPRQQLTATPVALHANSAFALDAADGSPANAVFVDNAGKVGIGTTTPQATIHLLANQDGATPGEGVRIQGTTGGADNLAYMSFHNSGGVPMGYVGDGGGADNNTRLTSYVGDVHIETPVGAVLTAKNNGNVGIGTTTPAARLDVRGDIKLGATGELQAPGSEEKLRIVRGRVSASGTVLDGSGFTASRTSTGQYSIDFVPNFAAGSQPAVTIGVDSFVGGPALFGMVAGSLWTTTAVRIKAGNGALTDESFHFIAIGPR